MNPKTKFFIGSLFVLSVLILSISFFTCHLVTKSFPKTTGSLTIKGLYHPVSVYRDEKGVPHLIAENEHDAYLAMGFVHAQDRLWQMELYRRIGNGRLSEIFGSRTLEFDKLFRTIGFNRIAEGLLHSMHPDAKNVLEAYTVGVNDFIEMNNNKYPIEFDLLRIEPEPWTIENSVVISRLLAWELNFSWWFDLEMGDLVDRFGEERCRELIPSSGQIPTVVSNNSVRTSAMLKDFRNTAFACMNFLQESSPGVGSNSWVVSGSRSINGKPLLANDPHLMITNPSKWYQMSIQGGSLCIEGVTIPGLPAVVIGRNRAIAWGLTNVMADDADFFLEKIDSSKPNNYIVEKTSRPLTIYEEEIKIRDSVSVALTVYATHHGPIISDVHASSNTELGEAEISLEKRYAVSMDWCGLSTDSQELLAFYLINHANTWKEFREALKTFTVPGQNFTYADTAGNIGYQAAVRIPIRGFKNPWLPAPGWESSNDWRGYVPFESLPNMINPPEGIIVTANNKIADERFPYYISNLLEPSSRSQRIRQLLSQKEKFSVNDFQSMQRDFYSPLAEELTARILYAYDSAAVTDPFINEALIYFRNWDFRFSETDIVTTIYQSWLVHMLRNTFLDEMGEDAFRNYVFLTNVPLRVLPQLMHDSTSQWFDNINTPEKETRDDIIRQSLDSAIVELRDRFGDDMRTWTWGKLHTITMRHLFGEVKPLDYVFNFGPYEYNGGNTAIMSGEYSFNHPYRAVVAASMRQIADMSDPWQLYSVITSGESGQPFSAHYKDQVHTWLQSDYNRLTLDQMQIKHSGWELLHLEP